MRKVIILFCLFCINYIGFGKENCFRVAGERYGIEPVLLYAIAVSESSLNPAAIHINDKNGTYDVGIMQINSRWFPVLEKFGIKEDDLYNPCQNIMVGAWILAQCMHKLGVSWKAVDCYNKGPTKAKHLSKYTLKVHKIRKRVLSSSNK